MPASKQHLRKTSLRQRLALTEEAYEHLNEKLLAEFKHIDLEGIKTLHTFLPIAGKREPDTFRMIAWLAEARPGIKIIVPRADFSTALMTHHEYLGREDLKENLYNILEPDKGPLHEGDIDLVLVPLLAVDQRGFRVGYGKGFYDRFLQGRHCTKIGISLFPPVDEITTIHEDDIRLDACLTPGGLLRFTPSRYQLPG